MAVCGVCFRHCDLKEGQIGFCGARICAGGIVRAANYGRITSLAGRQLRLQSPLPFLSELRDLLVAGSYAVCGPGGACDAGADRGDGTVLQKKGQCRRCLHIQ